MFDNLKLKDVVEWDLKRIDKELLDVYKEYIDKNCSNDNAFWAHKSYLLVKSILLNLNAIDLKSFRENISIKKFLLEMIDLEKYSILYLNAKNINNKEFIELENYFNFLCGKKMDEEKMQLFHCNPRCIVEQVLSN